MDNEIFKETEAEKINSMIIALTAAVAVVSLGTGTATGEADNTPHSSKRLTSQMNNVMRMEFDEHLARKKAEFRSVVDKIKAENDTMRRKYDAL